MKYRTRIHYSDEQKAQLNGEPFFARPSCAPFTQQFKRLVSPWNISYIHLSDHDQNRCKLNCQ